MDPDIIKVRDQQWAALIQDRIQSGLTVEEWCRQQNIGKYAYYYHLRRLRHQALAAINETGSEKERSLPSAVCKDGSAGFAAVPDNIENCHPINNEAAVLRVTLNDLVIEVSNDASDGILSLVREVMIHAS